MDNNKLKGWNIISNRKLTGQSCIIPAGSLVVWICGHTSHKQTLFK